MRLLIFAIAFLLFSSFITAGQPDIALHEKCLYPTVLISNLDENEYGTAVIVRSEKIEDNLYCNVFVTANHVVKGNTFTKIFLYNYKNWSRINNVETYRAMIYGNYEPADLAIGMFYTKKKMFTSDFDFSDDVYIGNDVFRIGCGLGYEPRLDSGKVTTLGKTYTRTSIYTVPGDSGGPVFHNNKIIAIMRSIKTMQNDDKTVFTFAISIATPIQMLKEWSNKENAIEFVWDNQKELPKSPIYFIELSKYEILN